MDNKLDKQCKQVLCLGFPLYIHNLVQNLQEVRQPSSIHPIKPPIAVCVGVAAMVAAFFPCWHGCAQEFGLQRGGGRYCRCSSPGRLGGEQVGSSERLCWCSNVYSSGLRGGICLRLALV